MGFPDVRLRRLRRNPTFRRMTAETRISVDDFIMPFFVRPGQGVKAPIASMPGQHQYSVDTLVDAAKAARDAGIPAILLFGIPEHKDAEGTQACAEDGVVCRAVGAVKQACPDLCVITDVCLCEYTDHGHCGILRENRDGVMDVDNDATLDVLVEEAVAHARAGADMVAPSDMMDGRIGAVRLGLDEEGFSDVPILAYSAKYASAFYGPFRDAAESPPQFGDRTSYQMDVRNQREALREMELDVEEGADILMVKPALTCLDVLQAARETFDLPLAAYLVSGEYAMVKAAAAQGWLDERRAVIEMVTAIRRAGAKLIVTYWAQDLAEWLNNQ